MSWRSYRDFRYREFFPLSVPRAAKGGIKAQSNRGAFGETWWANRWIEVLEGFQIGARLGRGRSYARRGQVLSIDIQPGEIRAEVQGSRPSPYAITIKLKPIKATKWKRLAVALGKQAVFAARLLAGEMPHDIEQAFKAADLSLFPGRLQDLVTDCSCPDWSNPCKHIAAVYYLLGEEFDRDPFLIFKLRGMNREQFVDMLASGDAATAAKSLGKVGIDDIHPGQVEQGQRHKAAKRSTARAAEDEIPHLQALASSFSPEPLNPDAGAFWSGGDVPELFFGELYLPSLPAVLPKRAGNFPFWRGEERFLDVMDAIYRNAAAAGVDVFLGQAGTRGEPLNERASNARRQHNTATASRIAPARDRRSAS